MNDGKFTVDRFEPSSAVFSIVFHTDHHQWSKEYRCLKTIGNFIQNLLDEFIVIIMINQDIEKPISSRM